MKPKKPKKAKSIITIYPADFNISKTTNENWADSKTVKQQFQLTENDLRQYCAAGIITWLTVNNKTLYYLPALQQLQNSIPH